MIKCNNKFGYGECVASMDAQQSLGGTIVCDFAEDCNFDEKVILRECDCAKLYEEE